MTVWLIFADFAALAIIFATLVEPYFVPSGASIENGFDIQTETIVGNVLVISFVVIHSYPGPGTYRISYREQNYNHGTQNIINPVNQPFIISALLVITPSIANNSSPLLKLFSNQKGIHGVAQTINPAAYDADGDSLSYKLIAPEVEDYSYPNHPDFYDHYSTGNQANTGEPEYSVNPVTGDILWDAPGFVGEYVIAVNITQWRKIDAQWTNIGKNEVVLFNIINDGKQEVMITAPTSSCYDKEADVHGSFNLQGPAGKEYNVEVYTDLEGVLINGEPVDSDKPLNYILNERLQLDITISPDQVLEQLKPYKVIVMVKTELENLTAGWGFAISCNEFPGNTSPDPIIESPQEECNEFLIYPNPTFNGYLNVCVPHISDGNKYTRVLDITGQTMLERYISPTAFPLEVDVTHFRPGVYIFQVENYAGKFIVGE